MLALSILNSNCNLKKYFWGILVADESRERWNWQYNKINFKKTFVLFWIKSISCAFILWNNKYYEKQCLNMKKTHYWGRLLFDKGCHLGPPKINIPNNLLNQHPVTSKGRILKLFCSKGFFSHGKMFHLTNCFVCLNTLSNYFET